MKPTEILLNIIAFINHLCVINMSPVSKEFRVRKKTYMEATMTIAQ